MNHFVRAVVLGAVGGAILVATPMAQAPNTLTAAEKAAGWRLLFDGKTTSAWHVYGGGPVVGWDIADGAMIALGQGGGHDIVTNDEFENFDLAIDWKVSPRANSGIFFHVVEGSGAIYATGVDSRTT